MISHTQTISYVELTLLFQECSIKYETMQLSSSSPVTFLYFNKISTIAEYDYLASQDFNSKCCGYLFLPESSKLTDQQKLANDQMVYNLTSADYILAEAVDERAEFVYFITHRNCNNPIGSVLTQAPFGIFRFTYQELWGGPVVGIIRNFHINNLQVAKQQLDLKNYFLIYERHISNWNLAHFNKEMMHEELHKEFLAKKKKQKVAEKDLDPQICVSCYGAAKNIVFFPCGHLCVCKKCAVEELQIELSKVFYKKGSVLNCLTCKKPIKEAKEVFL